MLYQRIISLIISGSIIASHRLGKETVCCSKLNLKYSILVSCTENVECGGIRGGYNCYGFALYLWSTGGHFICLFIWIRIISEMNVVFLVQDMRPYGIPVWLAHWKSCSKIFFFSFFVHFYLNFCLNLLMA